MPSSVNTAPLSGHVSIPSGDIGAAALAVQLAAMDAYASSLNGQLQDVSGRTNSMKAINDAMTAARALRDKAAADTSKSPPDIKSYPEYQIFKDAATQAGMSTEMENVTDLTTLGSFLDAAKSQIDGLSGIQSTEMIRTQSLLSNFTRVTDSATNMLKTTSDSKSGVARNL